MSPVSQVQERMQELIADRDHAVAEIDKLLTVAETLQDKCEARERRLYLTFVFLCFGLLFLGLVFSILALLPALKETNVPTVFIPCATVSGLGMLDLIGTLCFRDWRRQARDRTTIQSIVDMLREVESAMAKHVGFTALEEQHLKLRLQRFSIGPGADTVK